MNLVSTKQNLVLQLRDPEFDEEQRSDAHAEVAHSMDGTIYAHRSKTTSSLQMQFKAMPRKKSSDLRDFLEKTTGEQVDLWDWRGRRWRGKFTSATIDISTVERGIASGPREEFDEVRLSFEGSIV